MSCRVPVGHDRLKEIPSMLESALTALASNGPLALLAGMIVVVLWRKLTALQVHYEGDPSDTTGTKIGLVARVRQEAQVREDALRVHYDGLVAKERNENKQLWRDVNATLKGLVEGE